MRGSDQSLAALHERLDRMRADHARLLQRLAETERRFRAISRGVLRAQEAERSRISRDLHDGVGQSLTALKMQIELLARDAAVAGSPFQGRLATVRDVADQALHEIRLISQQIRPQILDNLGLVATLRWLARTFEQQTGVRTAFTCGTLTAARDPDVETLLYRVAQESLTNVAKHAQASSVSIELRENGDGLSLHVQDDGVGFELPSPGTDDEERGFGLHSMRDRVRLFGGRFAVRSSPGRGTAVEVDVAADEAGETTT